jgi:hypothetical protein
MGFIPTQSNNVAAGFIPAKARTPEILRIYKAYRFIENTEFETIKIDP